MFTNADRPFLQIVSNILCPIMQPIPVAILGATGYAGEISVRILLNHPGFRIVHAGSDRVAGQSLAQVVPAFAGETDLVLAPDTVEAIRASGAQAVILAKKSPEVTKVVPALLAAGLKLVDIGAEFRLRDQAGYVKWHKEEHHCPELLAEAVYGLSETHATAIKAARVVGNPGCFATSILLPLIPLVRAGLLDCRAPLNAISFSGLSGAGKKFNESNNNLFYAIDGNLHSYRVGNHQHTGEIDQELTAAAGSSVHLTFVPHLAPIVRGIHTTITATLPAGVSLEQITAAWQQAYAGRPFIRLRSAPQQVEVAHVAGTNFADFAAAVDGRTLIITSALDNLVKGASGQAVQNLNLLYGYPEETGLLHRGL